MITNTDCQIITEIIVGIFAAFFITKFLYSLYQKKNGIVLPVDSCSSCPFMERWDGEKYSCKLNIAIGESVFSHCSTKELKKHCQIKGKMEITITKQ